MWYESKNLVYLGMIEFGHHSITEIEVYRDKKGRLLFCDHDDPDEDCGIEWVKECVENCDNNPDYDDQVAEAERILGMKLR